MMKTKFLVSADMAAPINQAPTFLLGDGIRLENYSLVTNHSSDDIIRTGGKIFVASGNEDFLLSRYNNDGSLDTGFSSDGTVSTDFNGHTDRVSGIAAQADGKLLVVGDSFGYDTTYQHEFALARYDSDGQLDTGFSGDGKVTTNLTPGADEGKSVIVQSDGKILVTGYSANIGWDFALVRYNSNGSLDNSFSGDGKTITDFNKSDDEGLTAALQKDGKILVAGVSGDQFASFALIRYNSDGSLDNHLIASALSLQHIVIAGSYLSIIECSIFLLFNRGFLCQILPQTAFGSEPAKRPCFPAKGKAPMRCRKS